MHCNFLAGIGEIELDSSYLNITVYITEINKACVNYRQPSITIETGTDEI